MKFYVRIIVLLVFSLNTNAQDVIDGFVDTGIIPDNGTETCFLMNVSNIFPAQIDTFYGLTQVCFDIEHADPTQLDIFLVGPDSTSIEISTDNGDAPNYENVCFDMTSTISVTAVVGSFANLTMLPEISLGEMNNGQIGEGLWQLCITDDTAGDAGIINAWSITLDNNPFPPSGPISAVCNTNVTVGCQCPDGTDDCFLFPDIVIPPRFMEEQHTELPSGGTLLVTSVTSNIGYGTLEFVGSGIWYCNDGTIGVPSIACADGQFPKQELFQRIYKKSSTAPIDMIEVSAGFMQFHAEEGHDHPHIDNWIENTLRIKGPDPDPSTWPIVGFSSKVSFCAINSIQCLSNNHFCEWEGISYDINSLPNGRMGQFYTCNGAIQGVSVGYADVYGQSLEGQEIFFSDNICNGKYYIVSVFDPDSIFTEGNELNNVSHIPVYLEHQQQNCCVTNFEVEQLQEEGAIFQFLDTSMPEANSWIWDFGDGNFSNEQFPVHQYDTAGSYTVNLSTNNDSSCANFKSFVLEVDSFITSIKTVDLIEPIQVKVAPNPFSENTNCAIYLQKNSTVKIEVFDLSGKKIQTIADLKMLAPGKHNFEIKDLKKGVYFLSIQSNGKIYSEKLIVI